MSSTKPLKSAAILFAAACLAPLTCLAQGNPGTMYEVITQVIKPGMTTKFEQGAKDVVAYAQSHGDTTGASSFETVNGPNMGNVVVLAPYQWADQDNPPSYEAGLEQVIAKNVGPNLSSLQISIVRLLPNLGSPAPANATPQKYYQVISLGIKPGKMTEFLAAATQLSAAENKVNPQPNPVLIYQLVSGGDPNEIIVAIGHPDYADFGKPGKSNSEVLREAYGEDVATSVIASLDNSVASEQISISRYRPELSIIASGQGK